MLAIVGHLCAYFLLCSGSLSVIHRASSREISLGTRSFRGHSASSSLVCPCNADSSSDIALLLAKDSLSLGVSFNRAPTCSAVIVASSSRRLQSVVTISHNRIARFELASFLLELVV